MELNGTWNLEGTLAEKRNEAIYSFARLLSPSFSFLYFSFCYVYVLVNFIQFIENVYVGQGYILCEFWRPF